MSTKVDNRFKLAGRTFEIVVPEDYNPSTHLDLFRKKYCRNFWYNNKSTFNRNINDKNYSKVTTKLEPGRKLIVKKFYISRIAEEGVTSEDCLVFQYSQKSLFVGAQGISLVWEQKKGELPLGYWSISLDKENALWKNDEGDHMVPMMCNDSDNFSEFSLGEWEICWGDDEHGDYGYCLLCFYDK